MEPEAAVAQAEPVLPGHHSCKLRNPPIINVDALEAPRRLGLSVLKGMQQQIPVHRSAHASTS